MPNQNLIKSFIDTDGKRKLSEFESTDFAPISQGGTGATNALSARTNLDVPSNADLATVDNKTDGSVTIHSDITSAGSGSIITTAERNLLTSALQSETNTSLVIVGNELRYTRESGAVQTVDLNDTIKHIVRMRTKVH